MTDFGRKFKELRLQAGLSLRQFCEDNGLDPGNISKIERGVFRAPESPEKVEEYALALKLEPGSDNWVAFLDLAAADRGQLPRDLVSDEAIVGRLPVLFRTLRGQKVPTEKFDDLVRFLKESEGHGS